MGLGKPFRPAIFDSVQFYEAELTTKIHRAQLRALRMPGNESQLTIAESKVLVAIGKRALAWTPDDNPGNRWLAAMEAMRKFYEQATKRKGIEL